MLRIGWIFTCELYERGPVTKTSSIIRTIFEHLWSELLKPMPPYYWLFGLVAYTTRVFESLTPLTYEIT